MGADLFILFFDSFKGNCSFLSQVCLIANDEHNYIFSPMLLHVVDPSVDIYKALAVGDIVYKKNGM